MNAYRVPAISLFANRPYKRCWWVKALCRDIDRLMGDV